MSFQDAVRTCLQRKYADFSGRARRSEYWFFFLFNVIVSVVAGALNNVLSLPTFSGGQTLLGTIASLALLLPSLSVAVRRLHDTGKSGWFVLLGLIPVVGWIILLVFLVKDSDPAPNAYGPSPKALTNYA
jgi:uncharacterized membrane protein YhaH (DUF805 family)